jgi:hypothetical protein
MLRVLKVHQYKGGIFPEEALGMKSLIKFLLFILFINSFQFIYANVDGKYPPGIYLLGIESHKNQDMKINDKLLSWKNLDNNIHYKTLCDLMLETYKVIPNKKSLQNVVDKIKKVVSKAWREAGIGLLTCEHFKNHNNGKTKERFLKNIFNDNRDEKIFWKHENWKHNSLSY